MTTYEELFQRHREAEARVQEHQTLIDFHQKEMANIEETMGHLAAAGSLQMVTSPANGSLGIIETIRQAGNHMGAMQVLAKQNGNLLDLEHAARMIRMAGMSQSGLARLVSSLRCRANDSAQWETVDKDTVRFMPMAPSQEGNQEGNPEVNSEVNPEVNPEVNSEVNPEVNSEVNPVVSQADQDLTDPDLTDPDQPESKEPFQAYLGDQSVDESGGDDNPEEHAVAVSNEAWTG